MDAELTKLKRAALLGGTEEWEAYHASLSRCGIARHMAVLKDEKARINAALKQVQDKITAVQASCQHKWIRYHKAHAAGAECQECQHIYSTCGGICYTPHNCQHGPLVVEEDYWEKLYHGDQSCPIKPENGICPCF